jgi:hypothetical protein
VRINNTLVSAGAVLAVVALALPSYAGDYHVNADLVCQDCHVMHASQGHGYGGADSSFVDPTATANHYLLRNDVNDLCLSCHDGTTGIPDVFETNVNNTYVRQAGALNNLNSSGTYHTEDGHTLGATSVAPGGTFFNAAGLECVDCHNPHGSTTSYRNLRVSVPYAKGDAGGNNLTTAWVFEDYSSSKTGTPTLAQHYGEDHIGFNEPDATKSLYADFCKSCHTHFHADVVTGNGGTDIGDITTGFVRHPAAGVNIGAATGGHTQLARFLGKAPNQVQVMSPAGHRPGATGATGAYTTTDVDLTASCMSCHKGHGNKNAFGLIYMLGTGTVSEEGDNGVDARNLCRQCHRQGGAATNPW